jgi:hypothetical protein
MNVKSHTSPHFAGLIMSTSTVIICLVMLMPVAALIFESLASFFTPDSELDSLDTDSTFSDLADSVLFEYILN